MGIQRLTIVVVVLVVFTLQACAPVYIPSARHTHQLDEKGELSGAAFVGTNGADFQGAYAVSDQIGVAAALSFGTNEEEGSEDYHEHSYAEIGVDYFRPFGRIGRFELIGGGGVGSATSVDNYNFFGPQTVQATGEYTKLFVQSNVGLETSWLETGLALRLGHVTFTQFETSSSTHNESEVGTFFEPALFARLGWESIMLEAQIGAADLLQDDLDVAFDYRAASMSLGIHLNL